MMLSNLSSLSILSILFVLSSTSSALSLPQRPGIPAIERRAMRENSVYKYRLNRRRVYVPKEVIGLNKIRDGEIPTRTFDPSAIKRGDIIDEADYADHEDDFFDSRVLRLGKGKNELKELEL